jgi:hypothetical protein
VAISTEKSVLVSREGTTAAGNPTAIFGAKLATGTSDTNTLSVRVNQPIEEEIEGVTVVKDTLRFKGEWIVPNRRTLAQREAFHAMVKAAIAHALVASYAEDLDPLY